METQLSPSMSRCWCCNPTELKRAGRCVVLTSEVTGHSYFHTSLRMTGGGLAARVSRGLTCPMSSGGNGTSGDRRGHETSKWTDDFVCRVRRWTGLSERGRLEVAVSQQWCHSSGVTADTAASHCERRRGTCQWHVSNKHRVTSGQSSGRSLLVRRCAAVTPINVLCMSADRAARRANTHFLKSTKTGWLNAYLPACLLLTRNAEADKRHEEDYGKCHTANHVLLMSLPNDVNPEVPLLRGCLYAGRLRPSVSQAGLQFHNQERTLLLHPWEPRLTTKYSSSNKRINTLIKCKTVNYTNQSRKVLS